MRKQTAALLAGLALLLGACKDSTGVPDLNNVSAENLKGGLNKSSVQLLVTGLLNRNRNNLDIRYLGFTETMARDAYRIDPAEPRWITENIGVASDFSGFVGGGIFSQFYNGILTANTILDNIETAKDLTSAEISSVKGIAKTFKAIEYYRALEARDSLGIPLEVEKIDIQNPASVADAPVRCKANALDYIIALLDDASKDLAAGGDEFPIVLPAGFSLHGDFDTPETFRTFTEGWKGKALVYRGLDHQSPSTAAFTRAIRVLTDSSFLDVSAPMDEGVYYTYSTAPGETTNPLSDAALHLNPAVGDSILAGDKRIAKITKQTTAYSGSTVKTFYDFTYSIPSGTNLARPIALLKNAELILLRAQAEIGLNQLAAATADINVVHQVDGGLPAYPTFTTQTAAIDALLYEKRYSLLFESAHRLVDLRAYGRLNATYLKKETANDVFQSALPIPKAEADQRGGNVTPVCS